MKTLLVIILSTIVLSIHGQNGFVIQNVNLIDVPQEQIRKNQDVWINGAVIEKIQNHLPDQEIPTDYTLIDGSGKYLSPGWSEMHAHIPVAEDGDTKRVEEVLFLYASQGITLIRGMLGNPYHLDLKKQVASGELVGPRIYTSSPSVNGNSVPDIETAKTKVAQYAKDGYDFLKLHPGLSLPVFNQIVETANQVGIGYAGHVSVDVGVQRAIAGKYASIDHLDGYIEAMVAEGESSTDGGFFGFNLAQKLDLDKATALAEETKAQGVWVVPTQTLFTRWLSPDDPRQMISASEMQYMPSKVRYSWTQNKSSLQNRAGYSKEQYAAFLEAREHLLKTLSDKGVGILLGSDAPQVMNVPGFSIHHEMRAMAQAGMTFWEIMKSGTSNPASFFNQQSVFGDISVGLEADLVLLEANPIDNLANLQAIEGVWLRGRHLTKSHMSARLAEIADRHKE